MELIFQVCAEGGSIKLLGQQIEQGWMFHRLVSDCTAALIGEPSVEHESETAGSWVDAIRLMDEYQWYRLSPRAVHPAFRVLVWNEIRRLAGQGLLSGHLLESWREKCTPSSQPAP